jgi:kinesin family protein C2/C3
MNHLLLLQLASLKDTIARKDEEIERLQHQPQRLQKSMMRRKSIGHTDDINSDTGEYSSQSRYSVTDGESLASSAEAEYDERLSEITSDAASMGTQGSIDVTKRPPRISDRFKTTSSSCSCGFKRYIFSSFNVLSIGIAELSR